MEKKWMDGKLRVFKTSLRSTSGQKMQKSKIPSLSFSGWKVLFDTNGNTMQYRMPAHGSSHATILPLESTVKFNKPTFTEKIDASEICHDIISPEYHPHPTKGTYQHIAALKLLQHLHHWPCYTQWFALALEPTCRVSTSPGEQSLRGFHRSPSPSTWWSRSETFFVSETWRNKVRKVESWWTFQLKP